MPRDVPPSPGIRGLKRDPALVPLSRDHHFALRHALAMRRASGAGVEAARAGTVAREFLAFYRDELAGHFADEEEVLFPAARGLDPEGTERLLREHQELHALAARLRAAVDGAADPRPTLAETASLLDDHIRYEERAYFMRAQERLSPEALRVIGAEIERRRAERAAPSS